MDDTTLYVAVLAGGESTRIRTGSPKALLDCCGRPMLEYVLAAAESFPAAERLLVVGATHREAIEQWLRDSGRGSSWRVVLQPQARGTGDAVRCALEALPGAAGRLLILYGDTPLVRRETLEVLLDPQGGALLSAVVPDPSGYGRVVRDRDGNLLAIVEQADCDAATARIQEVNAGIYQLPLAPLRRAIARLRADNAQGEFYLTVAALQVLQEEGGASACLEEEWEEILGVNTLAELARAGAVMRDRILARHLAAGVIIDDPATTYIEDGVEIGPATRIHPFSVLRRGVRVGRGCQVGPFAHLRSGTVLDDGAEIGNFVETKNLEMGAGAKAKHLSYLGDAVVGARANIGCGTITANYDGRRKHQTHVGERAFIGSGTVLVAPVRVGKGAMTGAGAVVLAGRDVPDGGRVAGVPARPLALAVPTPDQEPAES